MPIRVQDELPAVNFLRNENVFVMTTTRATTQEIRPLKVLILNLMPKKIRRKISSCVCYQTLRCRWISSYCVSMRASRVIPLRSI